MRKTKKKIEPLKMSQYILWGIAIILMLVLNYWYLRKYLSFNKAFITEYEAQEDILAQYRDPAVAGVFYAGTTKQLSNNIDQYIQSGSFGNHGARQPRIIIVPHAGYIYSAGTAGKAYALLQKYSSAIKNVIIVGPSHYYGGVKAYLSSADYFKTPLGRIRVNKKIVNNLVTDSNILTINNKAHEKEHSIEVQLPFIQKVLPKAQIIPIVYGDVSSEELAQELDSYISQKDTLLVISADLSHYHPYQEAQKIDTQTAEKIANNQMLENHESCGAIGINTAMILAKKHFYYPQMLELINSGDVSSDKSKVVGYGAWSYYLHEEDENKQTKIEKDLRNITDFTNLYKEHLLRIAKTSIENAVKNDSKYTPSRRNYPEEIFNRGATFVTLHKNGELRGCIGSVLPTMSVAQDISYNAYAAAMSDKRFTPVTSDELDAIKISISLLSDFYEIDYKSERDLLRKIKEGVDGIIIRDGNRQGVFLPSVWEQLPDKNEFFKQLKIKAGMNPNYWNNRIKVYRFRTVEIKDEN